MHTPDAQTLIACAIGLVAAVHLLKRWWPQRKGLLARQAALDTSAAPGCGSGSANTLSGSSANAGCSAGCGQCDSAPSHAPKDHRMHIVRRAKA